MKFIERYPDVPTGETIIYNGDELLCHLALEPCIACRELTNFSSIIFGCPLCSQECYETFYSGFVATYNKVGS